MHIPRNVTLATIALLLIGLQAFSQQPRLEPLPIKDALAALSFSNFPFSLCPGDEQWIAYQLYDVRRWTRRVGKYGDLTASGVPTLGAGADIWLTNLNTGESRNLTRGQGSNWAFSWSPNGRYMAFYSDRDGRAAVWLWEKATDRFRKLSRSIPRPFMYGHDAPNWTPDSKKILVKVFPDEAMFERLVAEQVADPPKSTEALPQIYHSAADPKRAETSLTLRTDALTAEEVPDFKGDLALIDVSDGTLTTVAKGYVPAGYRLSPDGKKVAFLNAKGASKAGAAFDLVVVSLLSNKSTVVAQNLNQGSLGDRLTWSQASFDLTPFAGIPIQVEVRFSTDGSTLGTQGTAQGFWFDQVEVTNASSIRCDAQSNVCAARPAEVSPAGDPIPLTIAKTGGSYELRFSESAGAATYNVYAGTLASVRSGVYDHDDAGSLCAIGDGTPGDEFVTALTALQDGSYVLVVGANSSGESVYGQATAGPIPATLTSCP